MKYRTRSAQSYGGPLGLLVIGVVFGVAGCSTEVGDDGNETGGSAGTMLAGSAGAGNGAGTSGAGAQAGGGQGGSVAGSSGASGASGAGGTIGNGGSAGTSGSAGALTTGGSGGSGPNAGGAGGAGAGGTSGSGGTGSGAGGTSGTAGSGEVPDEPYCAPTESWNPDYAALEAEIVVIVNRYRAEGANCGGEEMPPAGPLTMDPNLQCAARVHTMDMAERDFFDHDNPDGDGPDDRMEAAGYDGRGWGENIAAGNSTAEETMEQWMNSPGHCRNIMNDGYTLIGVGYYPGGEYDHLWTQTFGG
jgi:uncharacterized protein YkwD